MLFLAGISPVFLAHADDAPTLTGEDYLSQCHDDSDADDYASAIESCSDALQAGGLDNAQTFMAYLYRGMAHNSRNEHDAAVADYTEAMAADPDHKDTDFAHFERGAAYADDKQYEKALADFDAAVKLKPDEGTYYVVRGNTRFDLGSNSDAITDLSKGIQLDPKDTGAYSTRSIVYLMQGAYTAAIADANQVLQLDAGDSSAHTEIGESYYFLGRYPEALAQFDAQLAKSPKDDYAMIWRFLTTQRAGQDGAKTLAAGMDGLGDTSRWTYVLGQFYQGKTGREQVLIAAAAAASTDADLQKQVLCQAKSFMGEFYRNSGQAAAAALFKDAMQLCTANSIGRIVAQRGLAAPKKAKKR
jgi:lipoprotein NlpI